MYGLPLYEKDILSVEYTQFLPFSMILVLSHSYVGSTILQSHVTRQEANELSKATAYTREQMRKELIPESLSVPNEKSKRASVSPETPLVDGQKAKKARETSDAVARFLNGVERPAAGRVANRPRPRRSVGRSTLTSIMMTKPTSASILKEGKSVSSLRGGDGHRGVEGDSAYENMAAEVRSCVISVNVGHSYCCRISCF